MQRNTGKLADLKGILCHHEVSYVIIFMLYLNDYSHCKATEDFDSFIIK